MEGNLVLGTLVAELGKLVAESGKLVAWGIQLQSYS